MAIFYKFPAISISGIHSKNKETLRDAVESLRNAIIKSDIQPENKLFIATKTVDMINVIANPHSTLYLKELAINTFYQDTVKVVPRQSDTVKAIMSVVGAAIGFALGVAAGSVLLACGLGGALGIGALSAASAAFFTQKCIVKKEDVDFVCDTAKKMVKL